MDDLVEQMITQLEKQGLLKNTYVVFSSDNGFHLGESPSGQFHDERDRVKINKYVYFHCKLIALTQTVLYVLGKNIFILLANLFS